MHWHLPDDLAINADLCEFVESYRSRYLDFFLDYFEIHHAKGSRGGYFNINSVSGRPYEHNHCYSWTDGRSLGELTAAYLYGLGDRERLRAYIEHLRGALIERYELNGYFPHVVDERTNHAVVHELNVRLKPGQSSFSHVFVLNGLWQYALVLGATGADNLHVQLLDELAHALSTDEFLEGAAPRPSGQRAQGPFMIALGALTDILETMKSLWNAEPERLRRETAPLVTLGRGLVQHILTNHYRAEDNAFWELSQDGTAVTDTERHIVTDPGHTLEFTGFAARFAAFLPDTERFELLRTCRAIFLWAVRRGFHASRDLVYKNVDRDTGQPIRDAVVADIRAVVAPEVYAKHFANVPPPVPVATFPWWVPMELIAAGSLLRQGDETGAVDEFILRAIRGIFAYYPSAAIDGLCYQTIGDGFFSYIDIPPATATLDLMHCHRSMRVFLREAR